VVVSAPTCALHPPGFKHTSPCSLHRSAQVKPTRTGSAAGWARAAACRRGAGGSVRAAGGPEPPAAVRPWGELPAGLAGRSAQGGGGPDARGGGPEGRREGEGRCNSGRVREASSPFFLGAPSASSASALALADSSLAQRRRSECAARGDEHQGSKRRDTDEHTRSLSQRPRRATVQRDTPRTTAPREPPTRCGQRPDSCRAPWRRRTGLRGYSASCCVNKLAEGRCLSYDTEI
jgi:hypothetical protein